MSLSRRYALASLLVVLAALPARADTFYLSDGEVIWGKLQETTEDELIIKVAKSGVLRHVPRSQVVRHEVEDDGPRRTPRPQPTPTPTPAPPPPAAPRESVSSDANLAALRKTASDGLAERAQLVAGARGLATYLPTSTGASASLGEKPVPVDLTLSRFLDLPVEDVLHDLWKNRGTTPDQRAKALRAVAGAVAWIEGEVLEVKAVAESNASDLSVTLDSPALRRRTTVRKPGRSDLRPHEKVRFACVLLVKKDEGTEFLAARDGDSLTSWPVEVVLLAAEIGTPQELRTLSRDAGMKLAERVLAQRVERWLGLRMRILCHACVGTKQIACERCNGLGVVWKDYLSDGQWHPVACRWCFATGRRRCELCKDGLTEMILKDSLRTFGTYGKALANFLVEGQSIVLDAGGMSATVKTWVRDRPTDPPRCEVERWTVDPQFGWRPADQR
jgi:hypothetical protein